MLKQIDEEHEKANLQYQLDLENAVKKKKDLENTEIVMVEKLKTT